MEGIEMAQQHVVRGRATAVRQKGNWIEVQYHNTVVVTAMKWDDEHETVRLDTGGYFTTTTKTRMNQAASQFGLKYRVFQKDKRWYVWTYYHEGWEFRAADRHGYEVAGTPKYPSDAVFPFPADGCLNLNWYRKHLEE
jgi:hypothetical protein